MERGEIATESYYTNLKELVCLNCPVISGCDENNKNCLYQKHPNSRREVSKRHYRKTHPNAREKLSDEQVRLNRIETQKRYRKKRSLRDNLQNSTLQV